MDAILTVIHALRESEFWTLIRVAIVIVLAALPLLALGMAVCREQLHAAAREGVRLAGLSNKAVGINAKHDESLAAKKLSGERPCSLDFLATQDLEAIQFFGLEILKRFGMPPLATTAADAQSRLQESR